MPDEPTGLNLEDPSIAEPPTPEPSPAEPPAPPAEPVAPPAEDETVRGLREAMIAERRERQRLEQEVAALKTPPKPTREVHDVSDEDAEKYARRYELYTPQGLDISRAKQIIADNRVETARIAKEAAEQAVAPVQEQTAKQAAREQFLRIATVKGPDGHPLIDSDEAAKELAAEFVKLPPQLAMLPEVADHVLDSVLGMRARSRRSQPKPPEREPLVSESPGGPRSPAYTISNLEKKVADARGIAHGEWEKTAKTYQPGVPNVLE